MKEIPKKMKLITVYNVIENYKINGTVRRLIFSTVFCISFLSA